MSMLTCLRVHGNDDLPVEAVARILAAYLPLAMPKRGWDAHIDHECYMNNAMDIRVYFDVSYPWWRRKYLQWRLSRVIKRPRWSDKVDIIYEV